MKIKLRALISVLVMAVLSGCVTTPAIKHNNQGKIYASKGMFKEAKAEFEKVMLYVDKEDPYSNDSQILELIVRINNHEINHDAAQQYFMGLMLSRGNPYDVLVHFNKAIEIDRGFHDVYNEAARLRLKLKQYDKAIKGFNLAIELAPDKVEYIYNRGVAYSDKGKYELSIKDQSKAISLDSSFYRAYHSRGLSFAKLSNMESAIQDFSSVIEINPKHAPAYDNRGYMLHQIGKQERACSDWQKACSFGACNNLNYALRKGTC